MKKFVYGVVIFHLLLITSTIFHLTDSIYTKNRTTEAAFAVLCSINYSVWRYGFFTPDVGLSNEVEIKTYNVNGEVKKYSTLEGFNYFLHNDDVGKRFYGFKKYNEADTMLQDICARSVAVYMMNKERGIFKVSYTLRSIHYPGILDYKRGEPVKKIEFYSTDFAIR